MPRPHSLHPVAEREVARALAWYRRHAGPATAGALADAIAIAVERVCDTPEACAPLREVRGETVRARRVPGFRYRLVFVVRPREVLFLALAHASRRPGYWLRRLR